MKITQERLKQVIKEELEVILTNEEAGEMFGEEVHAQLEGPELNEVAEFADASFIDALQLVLQTAIQMGKTFGPALLVGFLAQMGYDAFTVATAKDVLSKSQDTETLIDIIKKEITREL